MQNNLYTTLHAVLDWHKFETSECAYLYVAGSWSDWLWIGWSRPETAFTRGRAQIRHLQTQQRH